MAAFLNPVDGGSVIAIDKAVVMVGRHPDCDVVLKTSRKVSRKHCCLVQINDTFAVRDLGSMNGLEVNGKKVKRLAPLRVGDVVSIGDMKYLFAAQSAGLAAGKPAASGNGSQSAAAPPSSAANRSPANGQHRQSVPVSGSVSDDEHDDNIIRPGSSVPQTPIVRAPAAIDLSQDYPVPIPDRDADADEVRSVDFMPASDFDEFDDDDPDDFDDVIILDDD